MAAHLSYYEVLGLDAPPADRKAVKRAYSKMLKITRPEDDPEGFMRLRDAHDTALSIVARNAENAAWEAQQAHNIPAHLQPISKTDAVPDADDSLTYEDLAADGEGETEQNSSYSIGPSPSLDAPVTLPEQDIAEADATYAFGPTPSFDAPVIFSEPKEPEAPPLIAELNAMLAEPSQYNDRENWNVLFRKARQLDIDDYVDFEHLLLETILSFHGFYDHNLPNYDTPEKLPQKLSPSIAASLFKTMSWDQVNKGGYHKGHQIEWLTRRMIMRKRMPDAVPIPQTQSGGNGKIWLFLIGIFIFARILLELGNL